MNIVPEYLPAPHPMNIREKGEELIYLAKQISKYCSQVSCERCEKGKCAFSHKESRCIFNANGMEFPFHWDFKKEENK